MSAASQVKKKQGDKGPAAILLFGHSLLAERMKLRVGVVMSDAKERERERERERNQGGAGADTSCATYRRGILDVARKNGRGDVEGARENRLQRDAPAQGIISEGWERTKEDALFPSTNLVDQRGISTISGGAPARRGAGS
eukprot:7051231-Pyramimonas_sp.AAC.1